MRCSLIDVHSHCFFPNTLVRYLGMVIQMPHLPYMASPPQSSHKNQQFN